MRYAHAYGLTYEQAVQSITLNAAKSSAWTLLRQPRNRKDATLFISEGDALDMRTNYVTEAFIQAGRSIWTTASGSCTEVPSQVRRSDSRLSQFSRT